MVPGLLALGLLLVAPAMGAPPVPLASSGLLVPASDPSTKLLSWLEANGSRGTSLPSSLEKHLDGLLRDVAQLAVARNSKAPAARLALLEAAGWGLASGQDSRLASDIRARAQAVLVERLTPGRGEALADWMLFEVLTSKDRYQPAVRVVAVRALAERAAARGAREGDTQKILVGIMSAGQDGDSLVRQAANHALLARPEAFVSDYFLGALERNSVTPELFVSHLMQLAEAAPEARASWWDDKGPRVFSFVIDRLEDKDWREASRALAVARLFELKRVAPYLIQGLGVWSQRSTGGQRRIVHEFATALSGLSGHDYGEDPTVWARWWQAASAGGESPEPVEETSQATFFGLRPVSDRVLFVIDRSGSMREPYEGSQSRYHEAIERLLYTLRDLGPKTEFGVVLFSFGGRSFSDKLEPADTATLARLERWALGLGPDGGTDLHSGLEAAFPGLEDGRMPASAIPYDTVVVLCDGETEDPSWVQPWLARYNQAARLVFHCVNIGGEPGGVLEALAAGSGGAFVSSR